MQVVKVKVVSREGKHLHTGSKLQIEPDDSIEEIIAAVESQYSDYTRFEKHYDQDGNLIEAPKDSDHKYVGHKLKGAAAVIMYALDLIGRTKPPTGRKNGVSKERTIARQFALATLLQHGSEEATVHVTELLKLSKESDVESVNAYIDLLLENKVLVVNGDQVTYNAEEDKKLAA